MCTYCVVVGRGHYVLEHVESKLFFLYYMYGLSVYMPNQMLCMPNQMLCMTNQVLGVSLD